MKEPKPHVLCNREIKFGVFYENCCLVDFVLVIIARKTEIERGGKRFHQLTAGRY
jgi:tRNA U34 2-thiouridine synthase MnmA/TrmU